MKTQEEVVRRYAVGPINIYRIYQEGYQDRELDDWSSFRREAAKDAMCQIIRTYEDYRYIVPEDIARRSVACADELIKQLQEEKK